MAKMCRIKDNTMHVHTFYLVWSFFFSLSQIYERLHNKCSVSVSNVKTLAHSMKNLFVVIIWVGIALQMRCCHWKIKILDFFHFNCWSDVFLILHTERKREKELTFSLPRLFADLIILLVVRSEWCVCMCGSTFCCCSLLFP